MADEGTAVTTEAPAVTESSSVSTSISTSIGTPENSGPQFSDIIPQEYAETAWVKDVKDINGLFKMTSDLKAKMGERPAGIPHENSSPEEKAAFNKAFGVPENSGEYTLNEPVKGFEDFQDKMKDVFLKNGLSQEQAGGLEAGYNELIQSLVPDPEAQDAKFVEMGKKAFGNDYDTVMSDASALLEAHSKDLPDEFKDAFNKLPNDILVPLAGVFKSFKAKYINEDNIPKGGDAVHVAQSEDDKRAEGRRLMASEAYKNYDHIDHAATVAKANAIYGN